MEISGLLTDDLPTRGYRTPSISSIPYKSVAPYQQLSPHDDPKETLFHCNSHARIPLRLALRPTLTTADVDTLVRTFFGLGASDVIAYLRGDQSFATVGLEECLRTPEFTVMVTPDLRYQQHPFAPSHTNARHPSAHISGYGLPTRAQAVSQYTRSISPMSGRGRRSGSANGTNGGRSRSMKRQASGHSHPAVEELVDEYVHDHKLYQQQPHLLQSSQTDGKGNRLEPVASADISLDNIVEGSRRKRAKFSSAELPLFTKPMHPASYSPTRPLNNSQITTPVHNQYTYYQQHTPNSISPYSYGYSNPPPTYYPGRPSGPNFPTPAPTIATDISDEDVALQLMRLGEASTTSNSPSNNDETADDAGNFSEDQGDELRSDTTELPELPPAVEEYEDLAYSKTQTKYKTLNEILPSYDSTIPSDNEEPQCQTPETIKKEQPQYPTYQSQNQLHNQRQHNLHHHHHHHHHHHNHLEGDSCDEEDYDNDDAGDETYIAEKDEDDDGDYLEEEQQSPLSRGVSTGAQKHHLEGAVKSKTLNQVKTGRVGKALPKAPTKPKPKPTTTLYTAFSHAAKTTIGKGPLSPASPTLNRTQSISSNPPMPQKSRSATASITSLPTPISGIIPHHADSFSNAVVPVPAEEEIEKPKPRCQRCRKSKKGCDRQRPCQRCKDAGIGIEGCISEDESGTRRGRAGAAKKAGAVTGSGVKKTVKPKKKIATKY